MKFDSENKTIVFEKNENVDQAAKYARKLGWEVEKCGSSLKFIRWSDGTTVLEKDIDGNILELMEDFKVLFRELTSNHVCCRCERLFRDDEVVDCRGLIYCLACHGVLKAQEAASKAINKVSKN